MQEIVPGIFHWTTFHEGIGQEVHSAYVAGDPPVLIDPREPAEGMDWFLRHGPPLYAFLTNRHHFRHSDRFRRKFGTAVWCHRQGLHEFPDDPEVQPFAHDDELPGGILALPVAAICPEETALHIPAAGGILAFGDALIREDDDLGFVPDAYLGENPDDVKRQLLRAFRRLLETPFEHMLFAHGRPWIGGGREGLRQFVQTA
ncbi:MAG: hypothetical protein WDA20_05385 [Desulfuromonadales bacterium]